MNDQVGQATLAGIASARWPGRMEILTLGADGGAGPAVSEPTPRQPDLILDGARHLPADRIKELAGLADKKHPRN